MPSPKAPTDKMNWSTIGGLLALVLWSTTIAVSRRLSEQLGPITAATAVYLIGGVFCLLRLGWPGRRGRSLPRPSRKYLLGCGSLFVAYTILLYLAVGWAANREQAIEIGLINYLWPSLTILLSVPLLRHRARPLLWPGTALALAGIFFAMTQGAAVSGSAFAHRLATHPAPYFLALAAAFAWALYSNLARRWSVEGSPGAAEWFIPATGLLLLALRLGVQEAAGWTLRAALEASFLGALTALAYVLWDQAMRRGDLLLVAACSYFTPLLSTLVSCLYLRIVPSSRLWLGCLLIVAGSLASWRSISKK